MSSVGASRKARASWSLASMFLLSLPLLSDIPAQPVPEATSGVNFQVNNDGLQRPHTYAWAATDADNGNRILGAAIIHKLNCGMAGLNSCPSYYISFNGGMSWPTQATSVPGLPPGFDQTADPTTSFDRTLIIMALQQNLWANSGSGSCPSV